MVDSLGSGHSLRFLGESRLFVWGVRAVYESLVFRPCGTEFMETNKIHGVVEYFVCVKELTLPRLSLYFHKNKFNDFKC